MGGIVMKVDGKLAFALALITLLVLAQAVSAQDTQVVTLKSDSTWKAASAVSSIEWFKPDFDDSSWGNSVGRWPTNPCVQYCGKMTSCELTCIDWMWYNQSCSNCEVYFRKTINLPDAITSATIQITADNYYWLYINGNYVGSDTSRNGYQKTETYDITSKLNSGKNVIAIKAQNDEDNIQGVALTGEVKYQTYNTLLNQLQTQIDSLEAQVNSLSNDKNRLQAQADVLGVQVQNLSIEKDELTTQNSQLQLDNLQLKNANSQLQSSSSEAQTSLDHYRAFDIVLILALLITLGVLVASLYYFYNKLKGKKPRLSEPHKRLPTEHAAEVKEPTHLAEESAPAALPAFQRKRTSSLSGREM
jgi:hypothetical protein